MAIGDPFDTTYAGAYKAGSSLGEGLQSAAGDVADQMKKKQGFDMLKKMGLITEKTTPPTVDELKSNLIKEGAAHGKDVKFGNLDQYTNTDDERNFLTRLHAGLNIPIPQGKTTTTISPGVSFDSKGASYTAQKPEKTLPEQIAEYSAANKMLETAGLNGKVSVGSKNTTISAAPGLSDNLGAAGLTPDIINNSQPADIQAMLKDKNPSYFNKLVMLKDGLMPTSGRTSKELQQMYGDAGVLFPGEVDATKGTERVAMANNIAKGDIFKSSMRGNTLVGHMDTLLSKMEDLRNMQLRLGNAAKNTAEYQAGAKAIQGAKQAGIAVANEMEGYLRNSNILSELGIQQQLENIPINGSPEQQQEWMQTAGDLFNQRRNAINDTVKSVMGSKYKFDVLSDRSKKLLAKHGIAVDNNSGGKQDTGGQQQMSTPQQSGQSMDMSTMSDEQLKAIINGK